MFNFNLTPTVRNLLLLNVGFFFVQQYAPTFPLTELGSLYPIGSPDFYPWQFLSYMFLHADLGHIFGNMLGLAVFGPLLEQRWGARRFLTFWLICGVGAGALYQGVRGYELYRMQADARVFHQQPTSGEFAAFYRAYYPDAHYETLARDLHDDPTDANVLQKANEAIDFAVRGAQSSGMLGASGALFGLLFAFAYLFPNTELLLYFAIPVKAKYLVFGYGLWELFKGIHHTPGDTVAHYAHLSGLLIGFIVIKFWERGRQQFY